MTDKERPREGHSAAIGTVARVLEILRPYPYQAAIAVGLTIVACLLNLPVPFLIQGLVDTVVTGGHWSALPAFAVGLLIVFAAQAGFSLANTLVVGKVGQQVVRDLRHRLYERLQRLDLSYYDRTPTGGIISRLMDDVGVLQGLITAQTVTILTDLGTTLAITALLVARSGRLALVVLAFVPLYAVNFRYFMVRIRTNSTIVRDKMDIVFGMLKEKLDGTQVIKACSRELAEMGDFADQLEDAHGPRVRDNTLRAAFSGLCTMISGAGTAAVFAMGAYEVLQGRMTPGGVVSTAALAALLFGPVARLADLASVFEQAAASVERLGEILDLEPRIADPTNPLPLDRARGFLEFDQVGFGYTSGQPVLWDLRLQIEPGMKVALVGPTGCGKSTLVNLLLRFYDPTWGEIRLDGQPLQHLALANLRRQIGVVLQEPVVFHQTLADNIRYGRPEATDADVEAAARAALVHGFAQALPEGYQTKIGEGGHKLSQGERQRLAIARAICKDPALVVLDEATSSLDTAGEALIQAAMVSLLRGRTSIVIAHRLSTVLDADLIVVIDGGLIVEKGTHNELIADVNGLYRRLCISQFGQLAVAEPSRAPSAQPAETPQFEQPTTTHNCLLA
jgi:subfamily B ATP-binding cassette protein MsbA